MSTESKSEAPKHLLFQKVGVFIDAENIELSGLKHHEGRTDYKKIIEEFGDREIIRILYYKPEYKEISSDFESFFKSMGGEIKRPAKNADSWLIIDAVTLAEKMDVAVILGGDKDFLPLVWYLRSRGCRVEIWSWPEATSPEVKEAADFYFPITTDYTMDSSKGRRSNRTTRTAKSSDRDAESSKESGETRKEDSSRSSGNNADRKSGDNSGKSSGGKKKSRPRSSKKTSRSKSDSGSK